MEVALGPLPIRLLHFVAPSIFALIASCVGGVGLVALVSGPTDVLWTCTRLADRYACEEHRDGVPRGRFEGAAPEVVRTTGHYPEDCIALGARRACGGRAAAAAATLSALRPGQSASVDLTEERELVPLLCSVIVPLVLLGTAIHWTVLALGRRRVYTVALTPTTLEPAGAPPVPRVAPEAVTVVCVRRGGRGRYPVWAIDYGNRDHAVRLGTWMSFSGPRELEPAAQALRRALGPHAT